MLDVHPPHAPTHTWKDFLIHIATIVCGLLIAVGLEQGVEYLHHRKELSEAREQLLHEREINRAIYQVQRREIARMVPLLKGNLVVLAWLRQHPHAPHNQWPGELSWHYTTPTYFTASWTSLHESQALARMPQAELQDNTFLYTSLNQINAYFYQVVDLMWQCFGYGVLRTDPADLPPPQLDDNAQAVTRAVMLYAKIVNLQMNLSRVHTDFPPGATLEDQRDIVHVVSPAKDVDQALRQNNDAQNEIKRIQDHAIQ